MTAVNGPRPLVVDLDGTLLRGDLLAESYLAFLRRRPLCLLAPFLWLWRGRAAMKSRLAAAAAVDIANLPYDEGVLALIDAARDEGRPVVLATASDSALARQVADHLGRFDRVLASDGRDNLKGVAKAALLTGLYGHRGFDYVGNSHADLPVWQAAATAFVANPAPGLLRRVRRLDTAWELVGTKPARARLPRVPFPCRRR